MLSHYLRVDFQPNVTISYIYLLLTATCNPEKGLQSAHACAGAAAAWEGPNLTSNVHGGVEKKRGGDLVLKEAHAETLELLW